MSLRAIALTAFLSLFCLSGCTSTEGIGEPPPAFKLANGPRLMYEIGWFYADIQDMVFGVDYYRDMDFEFDPTGLYE